MAGDDDRCNDHVNRVDDLSSRPVYQPAELCFVRIIIDLNEIVFLYVFGCHVGVT